MIDQKYYQYVFVAVMATAMGFFMSFAMTLLNAGFSHLFFQLWGKAFLTGVVIAFPTALVISPIATTVAERLTRNNNGILVESQR